MIQVVAFHGNPAQPSDWKSVRSYLPQVQWTDAGNSVEVIDPSQTIFVGHSWGCYRILKLLPQIPVKKAVLVAPYLVQERPLSGLAIFLLQKSFLKNFLIEGNHRKTWESFMMDLFYPEELNQRKEYLEVKKFLQNPESWHLAVKNKIAMQLNPLRSEDICKVPLKSFFGTEDKISSFEPQSSVLNNYPHSQIQKIEKGGHGLIWSHAQLIAEEIAK